MERGEGGREGRDGKRAAGGEKSRVEKEEEVKRPLEKPEVRRLLSWTGMFGGEGAWSMASGPASFYRLFFFPSSVGVNQQVGTGNQGVVLWGLCCRRDCVLSFSFLAIQIVKQADLFSVWFCLVMQIPSILTISVDSLSLCID